MFLYQVILSVIHNMPPKSIEAALWHACDGIVQTEQWCKKYQRT